MSRNCNTHFHACDCREEKFQKLEKELDDIHTVVAEAMAALHRVSPDDKDRVWYASQIFEKINNMYHARKKSEKVKA